MARGIGKRCLIVTGRDSSRAEWLRAGLEKEGIATEFCAIAGEPGVAEVDRGARTAREFGAELVLAVGGGSAIDAGKAIAALTINRRETIEYLEVIGACRPLEHDPIPFIAIPTTAGTGAEVTRNAVLTAPEQKVKVSLRSAKMLPLAAIVDPELTYDLPPGTTASTGMDALTQLIEPFLCLRANPLTDALCREALPRVARALSRAFHDGGDIRARRDMALGSLFGGLALANAGLGAVHGFAAPIGGMFSAPHGAVCAALLPHVLEVNWKAVKERKGNGTRFEELGRLLTGNQGANGAEGIRFVRELCAELKIPKLGVYGIRRNDHEVLCEKAAASSSMKANPIPLMREELREILARAT